MYLSAGCKISVSSSKFSVFLPSRCCSVTFEDIRPALEFYDKYLDRPFDVQLEFALAIYVDDSYGQHSSTVTYYRNQPAMKNVRTLLLIFATLPVTSA